MAHFAINITGNLQADIYKGSITKKSINLLNFWKGQSVQNDKKTGYVARVNLPGSTMEEYLLVKQPDGNWLAPENEPCLSIKRNGKWQPIADDDMTIEIKKAIDEYENNKDTIYEKK